MKIKNIINRLPVLITMIFISGTVVAQGTIEDYKRAFQLQQSFDGLAVNIITGEPHTNVKVNLMTQILLRHHSGVLGIMMLSKRIIAGVMRHVNHRINNGKHL